MRAQPDPAGKTPKIERKGNENLKLAAGAFRCEVLQVAGARIFRSAKVPLWGLVRAVDSRQRVELIGYAESGAGTVFPPGFDDPKEEAAQGNGSESAK